MIKGINKCVVIIRPEGSENFEEIHFYLRNKDINQKAIDHGIVAEATKIIHEYELQLQEGISIDSGKNRNRIASKQGHSMDVFSSNAKTVNSSTSDTSCLKAVKPNSARLKNLFSFAPRSFLLGIAIMSLFVILLKVIEALAA